jgi:hypothetical protein
MKLTACSLSGLTLLLAPAVVEGQSSAFRPHASVLFEVAPPLPAAVDTLNLPKTYWKEGALIGGIPMLVFGGLAGRELCETSESADPPNCALATFGTALIFGAMGGVAGAMVGGLFEKESQ